MSSSGPAIRVKDVGKCYEIYAKPADRLWQTLWRGRRQLYREFWAVRDISFDVERGDCVGILGANGSGKSTLLSMIAGTMRVTTGSIDVRGRVSALLELGSGFNPEFTGRANVFMNGAILGLSEAQVRDRFDSIAAFADIGDFIDQPVKTYSSGMMLRLSFAVQVQIEPDVLLVDEALAVGDARFQLKCMNRLEQLREQGTTVLFVSHSIEQVKQLCNKAVLLHQGEKVMEGDPVECGLAYYRILFPSESASTTATENSAEDHATATETADDKNGHRYVVDMSEAKYFGRGGVTVTGVTVDGLRDPNLFAGGEHLIAAVTYEFDYDLIRRIALAEELEPLLHFGIRVDSHQGISVTDLGINAIIAFEEGVPLATLEEQGPSLTLRFKFRPPELQKGDYFLSPGIALGRTGLAAPLAECVHLFAITSTPSSTVHGLMRWECVVEGVEDY